MDNELNQVQDEIDFTDSQSDIESVLFEDGELETPYEENEVQDTPIKDEVESKDVVEDEKKEMGDGQEQTQVEQDNLPFMTIKFNKEDKGLSKDEAISYAQKGMNYDHMMSKFSPTYDKISQLAAKNGMSMDQYLAELDNAQSSYELQREVETLKEQYPDADDNLLNELAKARLNNKPVEEKVNEVENKQVQEEENRKQEIGRQLDKFKQRHPDVDPQKLDTKVYDLMRNGFTLLEAYESVQVEKIQEAQKQQEFKEKNRSRSFGNMSNNESLKDDLSSILFDED